MLLLGEPKVPSLQVYEQLPMYPLEQVPLVPPSGVAARSQCANPDAGQDAPAGGHGPVTGFAAVQGMSVFKHMPAASSSRST